MRHLVVSLAVVLGLLVPVPSAHAALPSRATWEADVREVMSGSLAYLERTAESAAPGELLALNLDIDNSMLATHYAPGEAVAPTLALARKARSLGVKVFVNTARKMPRRAATREELRLAGYVVDGLCMRRRGVDVAANKQRCRARFVEQGYRLVANVGNNSTDFVGGGFDRAYRLPHYRKQLS